MISLLSPSETPFFRPSRLPNILGPSRRRRGALTNWLATGILHSHPKGPTGGFSNESQQIKLRPPEPLTLIHMERQLI
ncbi:hypothetical protein HYQ46_007987 [Verticillium longisporum]|nr:hypothetical protein HYQ46_007987 [Verticillium longisporum]